MKVMVVQTKSRGNDKHIKKEDTMNNTYFAFKVN